MYDVTIHLRGGQSITLRVEDFTWRRDSVTGGVLGLTFIYPGPANEHHQLSWVRVEAVDAITSEVVIDQPHSPGTPARTCSLP